MSGFFGRKYSEVPSSGMFAYTHSERHSLHFKTHRFVLMRRRYQRVEIREYRQAPTVEPFLSEEIRAMGVANALERKRLAIARRISEIRQRSQDGAQLPKRNQTRLIVRQMESVR
jgi:hypothetical protein